MSNLLSTAVMKADIGDSTTKFRMLTESDLSVLLSEQKQFALEITAKHGGTIVKGEGDAFWVTFPSVTAAALAAIEMQEELRLAHSYKGDDSRLAMRIVITLGDVLHQGKDIFGDAVTLAARIETITPTDQIYLSVAAWSALNKAEVRTSFVNEFFLKSFPEPVRVYKVDEHPRTRIIKDQIIVFTDVRGYTSFSASHPTLDIERLLDYLQVLHRQTCHEYQGVIRNITGEDYFLTFAESRLAIVAASRLCDAWEDFRQRNHYPCTLGIILNKGDIYAYHSFLYGTDINVTVRIGRFTINVDRDENSIFVTGRVKQELAGTEWDERLRSILVPEDVYFKDIEVYKVV